MRRKSHFKKRILSRSCCFLLLMSLWMGVGFHWNIFGNVAASENPITQNEIQEGLDFCAQYPIRVKYAEQQMVFSEDDCPPFILRDRTLIPIRAVFEHMGATVTYLEDTQEVIVSQPPQEIRMVIGGRVASVDGVDVTLDTPPLIIDHNNDGFGSTMVPLRFLSEGLGYQVLWNDKERMAHIHERVDIPLLLGFGQSKKILLDPGHGGRDPGAIGTSPQGEEVYESHLNLQIALRLKELLIQAGANVGMTRETDKYLDKYERVDIANEGEIDIFLSIHNNSSDSSWIHGTTTYYYDKMTAQGESLEELYGIQSGEMAEFVQQKLSQVLGTKDNGAISYPQLAVLNKTSMPAIVVEGAYLSNSEDIRLICQEEYVENYAYGVALGIINYLNQQQIR